MICKFLNFYNLNEPADYYNSYSLSLCLSLNNWRMACSPNFVLLLIDSGACWVYLNFISILIFENSRLFIKSDLQC